MLKIVFVDENIIVVNKPAGLPCHPLHDPNEKTVLSMVVENYPEVANASSNPREGGLCHRVDNNTSGLLIFARNEETYQKMRWAITHEQVSRTYYALVSGIISKELHLNLPIAHHPKNKRKMVVVDLKTKHRGKPKEALTSVYPLATGDNATFVKVEMKGGRRHQIRVHLANEKFPLVGDTLYGGPKAKFLPGQALHACELRLPGNINLSAPVPMAFCREAKSYKLSGPLLPD